MTVSGRLISNLQYSCLFCISVQLYTCKALVSVSLYKCYIIMVIEIVHYILCKYACMYAKH